MPTLVQSALAQFAILAVLAPLSFIRPELGTSLGRRWGLRLRRLTRPRMAPFFCGLVAFLGSAAHGLLVRFPVPQVHDEFSYLLAGETFARGRLANPSPPFPEFFETFHVLLEPTYASKYPPGQGLLLALGQVVGGHPIVGAWLGTALACAAICWMLQGWVPGRWALLGGLLASIVLGFSSLWSQSYWGGSLAAAGGALLFGAVGRIGRGGGPALGVVVALGLATLAVTRPFEGLLFSLPLGFLMGAWLLPRVAGPQPRSVLASGLVTLAALIPFAAALAHYNASVTGDFARMPYAEYEEQYGAVPVFLWAEAGDVPDYSNDVFRRFQTEWALPEYELKRTLKGYLRHKPLETFWDLLQILPLALLLPLLAVGIRGGGGWDKAAVVCLGLLLLSLMGTTFPGSRKLAPAAGPAILLAIQGLRRLRSWNPEGRPVGRSLARLCVVAVVISAAISFFVPGTDRPSDMARARAEILAGLESTQESHLVFVRYSPSHNTHREWVYNRADLENAKVVWARFRTEAENRRLSDHFRGRRVWLLDADDSSPRLREYRSSEQAGAQPPERTAQGRAPGGQVRTDR
ncbi:MAG: hypothetical protein ACWGSQ_12180 [Longimicrobiales bacterium]